MSWGEMFKGVVNSVKDSGASVAIERWLARELADYGELKRFQLLSRERRVAFEVLLKGETNPIAVNIDEYQVITEGQDDFIVVKRGRASRPWVDAVIRNFLIDKKHKIPAQYKSMARMVLNG